MTNATKAIIIAVIDAALGLAAAFGLVLTPTQHGALFLFANVAFGAWVALTYRNSPRRIPDDVAGKASRR